MAGGGFDPGQSCLLRGAGGAGLRQLPNPCFRVRDESAEHTQGPAARWHLTNTSSYTAVHITSTELRIGLASARISTVPSVAPGQTVPIAFEQFQAGCSFGHFPHPRHVLNDALKQEAGLLGEAAPHALRDWTFPITLTYLDDSGESFQSGVEINWDALNQAPVGIIPTGWKRASQRRRAWKRLRAIRFTRRPA